MSSNLIKLNGVLRPSERKPSSRAPEFYYMVVDLDTEIGDYLRHLFWLASYKTIKLQKPAWKEHLTIIREKDYEVVHGWDRYAGRHIIHFTCLLG